MISDSVKMATAAFLQEAVEVHGIRVSILIALSVVLMIILELFSLDTTRAILEKPGGKDLYTKAVMYNFTNYLFIGIPVYTLAAQLLCTKDELSTLEAAVSVVGIIFTHNVVYYYLHRMAHLNPSIYKYHKFHHQFNTHTPPMSANAVEPIEYLFAYIAPFGVGLLCFRSNADSLVTAAYIISILNLIVHTPKLEALSEKYLPKWLVSTHDHQEHHRKVTTNYASPTLNIDYFVNNAGKSRKD